MAFKPVKVVDNPFWSPQKKLQEIYNQYEGDHDLVLEAVSSHFGWTRGEAYWATEFLYRPENYN